MRLSIVISRPVNLLFFAQKKDQYHPNIFNLQKYSSDNNLDLLFYEKSERRIWEQIRKTIGKQNVEKIKETIASLQPSFITHWHRASKNLLSWKQYFENNQILLQKTFTTIKKLSGVKNFPLSKTPLYIVSDIQKKYKEINAWFSWTPKKNFIVIEVPPGLKPNSYFPLSILMHEFFHLVLRRNKKIIFQINKVAQENKQLLTKISKECTSNRIFLEELLISSFIPEGQLSKKYFHTKINNPIAKPKNLLLWRKTVAYKSHSIAKKYIDNTQEIDTKYIQYIAGIIKKSIK
jgi:hypothetical protein